MYHKTFVLGNLGSDPELRYTPQGDPVCNFSVAANENWTNTDGSKGERTTWYRVTCWRRLAETCSEYLSKGRQVFVEGRLKPNEHGSPRTWTGSDGEVRATFELTAQVVKFLGGRNGTGTTVAVDEETEIPF